MTIDLGLRRLNYLWRIIHARMIDALERIDKRLANARDILKGQVALVELAAADALVDDHIHQLLQRLLAVLPAPITVRCQLARRGDLAGLRLRAHRRLD